MLEVADHAVALLAADHKRVCTASAKEGGGAGFILQPVVAITTVTALEGVLIATAIENIISITPIDIAIALLLPECLGPFGLADDYPTINASIAVSPMCVTNAYPTTEDLEGSGNSCPS